MKTTYPKILTPTSGLTLVKGVWKVTYTTDGRRRYRTLGTSDQAEAIRLRDEFYASLAAKGATHPDRRMKVSAHDTKGIYRVKPFVVKIHGTHVGNYETMEQAMVAKQEHLEERGLL